MSQRSGVLCQRPQLAYQQHPSLHQSQQRVALGVPRQLSQPQEMHSRLRQQRGSSQARGKLRWLPRQPKPPQQRPRLVRTGSLQPSRLRCLRWALCLSQVRISNALGIADIFQAVPFLGAILHVPGIQSCLIFGHGSTHIGARLSL